MESEILRIIILTLTPFVELRLSIPYGIFKTDLHWGLVWFVAVAANAALGPMIYLFVDKVLHIFLRVKFLDRIYQKVISRTQKKIEPYVQRYGHYGVALFIAVPIPGSGSYSGALGSYLLGIDRRKFWIANAIGAVVAGSLMVVFSLTGEGVVGYFLAR